jgi:mannose-1-phosphate guanylyltransferase
LLQASRPVFGYREQAYWLDVGTPAALFKGSRDLISGEFQSLADCLVSPTARILGKSSLGRAVKVGERTTIDDCIIGDGVEIGEDCQLRHCFISHGTQIAPGTISENFYHSPLRNEPINF